MGGKSRVAPFQVPWSSILIVEPLMNPDAVSNTRIGNLGIYIGSELIARGNRNAPAALTASMFANHGAADDGAAGYPASFDGANATLGTPLGLLYLLLIAAVLIGSPAPWAAIEIRINRGRERISLAGGRDHAKT